MVRLPASLFGHDDACGASRPPFVMCYKALFDAASIPAALALLAILVGVDERGKQDQNEGHRDHGSKPPRK